MNQTQDDEQLIEQTLEIIRHEKRVSTSLIQRRLRLGYVRAAQILNILEARGIVGPGEGAMSRDILVDLNAIDSLIEKAKPESTDQYFLLRNDKEEGPFTEFQLRSMWRAGSITGDVLFSQPGAPEWLPLSKIAPTLEKPEQPQAPGVTWGDKQKIDTPPFHPADMLGLVVASILLPIVGFIVGAVNLKFPARKEQAGGLIIASVFGCIVGFAIYMALF